MNTKVTLSFDDNVIRNAKKYAAENNLSLSRLTEFLLRKVTTKEYRSLEDLPIADWVNQVAEGPAVLYTKKMPRKELRDKFFESKK